IIMETYLNLNYNFRFILVFLSFKKVINLKKVHRR
ncbi:unnamed protein product, partial [marine sediment metagenome]